MPAVSFLKAPGYQDGHAGYSDPIDEQHFLVETINRIERLATWPSTAIIVAYDDSDGWYDHVMPPIVNRSNDPANDALLGPSGLCGAPPAGAYLDRCGYGPRTPLLVDLAVRASQRGQPRQPRTRPRSRASSRTTGGWAVSATSRSTPLPTRSRGCSHSGGRRRRRRSSSMPAQDESSAASSPTIALSAPSAFAGTPRRSARGPGVEPGFRRHGRAPGHSPIAKPCGTCGDTQAL